MIGVLLLIEMFRDIAKDTRMLTTKFSRSDIGEEDFDCTSK